MVQFSHPYMTPGKTIALTRWTFVGRIMSLLFNMLSRLVIAFLLRNKMFLRTCYCINKILKVFPKFVKGSLDNKKKKTSLRLGNLLFPNHIK